MLYDVSDWSSGDEKSNTSEPPVLEGTEGKKWDNIHQDANSTNDFVISEVSYIERTDAGGESQAAAGRPRTPEPLFDPESMLDALLSDELPDVMLGMISRKLKRRKKKKYIYIY